MQAQIGLRGGNGTKKTTSGTIIDESHRGLMPMKSRGQTDKQEGRGIKHKSKPSNKQQKVTKRVFLEANDGELVELNDEARIEKQ